MAISLRVYQFQVGVRLPRSFDACNYLMPFASLVVLTFVFVLRDSSEESDDVSLVPIQMSTRLDYAHREQVTPQN